ncbi:MAG TPA: PQQ-binding-like beta-propeller repeat protein, partial [Myxococcales bacterium]|nr:PQQ-binding-like beta-propeller repeat protein [Myxococcales bacterium]
APAIGGDGTVFFGATDGSFYAVNPNGSQRFKITTGARVSSSPAIGPDGTVYFVSDDGNLYAIQ